MMSGLPSRPSTPGRDSAVCSRSSRSTAVGHGQRPVADAVGAAGRVVAGDDHQPAVGRDQRGLGPGVGGPLGSHPGRLARISYLSSVVRTVAYANRWRQHGQPLSAGSTLRRWWASRSSIPGGWRPGRRRRWRTAGSSPGPSPSSSPWQNAPPKLSPAPSPLIGVDRGRRHLHDLVPGHAQHTLGTLLDDGDLHAGVQQRLRRPGGARSRRPRPRTPPCCRSRR